MATKDTNDKKDGISRRDFLTKGALGSFFLAASGAVFGGAILPKPAVSPGPSRKFKIGAPSEFPGGTAVKIENGNFFLFRDGDGFYAITAVCTHLGCIVARGDDGFTCPCHGSRFTEQGKVAGGPAPRALQWLKVSLAPDGNLLVDADLEVPIGTKLAV